MASSIRIKNISELPIISGSRNDTRKKISCITIGHREDRAGYRSHGSWGAEDDTYIMFFDAEAYDRFLLLGSLSEGKPRLAENITLRRTVV